MKRILAWAAACVLLIQLTACGQPAQSEAEGAGGSRTRNAVQSSELQFADLREGQLLATIETTKGTIQVVLYPELAPLAVENFRQLADCGFYNGTDFHRVLKDFSIQAGQTGAGDLPETSIWGRPFQHEFSSRLFHFSGALCMAAAGENPDTNLSQFYIVQTAQDSVGEEMVEQLRAAGVEEEVISTYQQAGGMPFQDYRDTVFGQVYGGMDVVDAIGHVAVDEEGRPKSEIKILSIQFRVYTSLEAAGAATAQDSQPQAAESQLPAGEESPEQPQEQSLPADGSAVQQPEPLPAA